MREEAQARILTAAEAVFTARGYEGASLTAITKAAGVSYGLASYYFKNKEQLLQHVLHARVDAVMTHAADTPAEDPGQALAEIIDYMLYGAAADPASAAAHLSVMLQPDAREVYVGAEAAAEESLTRAENRLRQIFAARGARRPDVEEVLFRSVLEGAMFKIAVYGSDYPVEQIRRRIYEIFELDPPAAPPDDAPPVRLRVTRPSSPQ